MRQARSLSLPADAEVVVYGSGPDCPQSQIAAQKLLAAGYLGVRAFSGGLAAWTQAGLPTEHEGAAAA